MMEAPSSDSGSEVDHVPGRISSTDSSFVFIEEVWSGRPEYQNGFFLRLDREGKPILNGGTTFTLFAGAWTNVGFSNELIFYRAPSWFQWEDGFDPDEYTYNCYVANGDLMQVMPIRPHPYEWDDAQYYSIVALGLSWFDSDCWKLIAVLKSNLGSRTFGDDEFAKIKTFDPDTGTWTTAPARFSDDFKFYFESDSDLFYLTSSPVYHGEALYWVHGWNAKGITNPHSARYPWNVDVPVPGRECKLRPLSLLKLCLKTNLFRVIHMPVIDKRNVGLLCKSEGGRVTYCHLCPDAGLSIWVLNDDDDDDNASSTVWRQTLYIHPNLIDFCHDDDFRFLMIRSGSSRGYSKGYEDEEDVECRICNKDFISVLAFNQELHTIVFKINDCSDYVVCFDFEEKKVVSNFNVCDYITRGSPRPYYLEHQPAVPPGEVARMWIDKRRAPYKEKHLWLFRQGFIDDSGFAVKKGLGLTRKRSSQMINQQRDQGDQGDQRP